MAGILGNMNFGRAGDQGAPAKDELQEQDPEVTNCSTATSERLNARCKAAAKRPPDEERSPSPAAKRRAEVEAFHARASEEEQHARVLEEIEAKAEPWTCRRCGENNKGCTSCRNCQLSKSEQQQPQWTCSKCDEVNKPTRKKCNNCDFARADMEAEQKSKHRADAWAAQAKKDKFTPLRKRLMDGSLALALTEWLEQWYVSEQLALMRRQDLPAMGALARAETAVSSVDTDLATLVFSHGWLEAAHPDRLAVRRDDIARVLSLNAKTSLAFWDFVCLHQPERSAKEERQFKDCLEVVHLVFTNPRWKVCRITTLPNVASGKGWNATPYGDRGWCHFESFVAELGGCRELVTIHRGVCRPGRRGGRTQVPPTAARFKQELLSKRFTRAADRELVTNLYRKVLAELEELEASAWGDTEVRDLLAMLPVLARLEFVKIDNTADGCMCYISDEVEGKLQVELKIRGGCLTMVQAGRILDAQPGSEAPVDSPALDGAGVP